ncbi:MAG: hypothetical protein HY958_10650 [Bacteroidia bacterium]|nr:hypothetical protein [Bacteroidia bacterium]
MKTKILFLVIAACFFRFGASSQTTPVRIIDFMVLPAYSVDTTQQGDTIMLNVLFKTDNAAQANKAMLFFGTANDASDVKLVQANFSIANDTTFITYSGTTKPVVSYATNIWVKLSQQQYDIFSHATLYVEDISGLQTERLYFQKY